ASPRPTCFQAAIPGADRNNPFRTRRSGLHVARPRVGLASANESPRIRSATVGRPIRWRPAPICALSRFCSGTGIWKPPPNTCICRSGTCRQLTIRWTVSLYPAPRTSAAALNEKTKNDSAHLRGGRHSSHAGRSLPGPVSIQLWLSAAQSLSCHSALSHRGSGRPSGRLPELRAHQAISYNSCRNRHCPKCQTQGRERWLAARERELLTTSYFQQFARLMRRLHRHDWVVYAKPAFGGPMQVLRYLGRYTHRLAISNHRLL